MQKHQTKSTKDLNIPESNRLHPGAWTKCSPQRKSMTSWAFHPQKKPHLYKRKHSRNNDNDNNNNIKPRKKCVVQFVQSSIENSNWYNNDPKYLIDKSLSFPNAQTNILYHMHYITRFQRVIIRATFFFFLLMMYMINRNNHNYLLSTVEFLSLSGIILTNSFHVVNDVLISYIVIMYINCNLIYIEYVVITNGKKAFSVFLLNQFIIIVLNIGLDIEVISSIFFLVFNWWAYNYLSINYIEDAVNTALYTFVCGLINYNIRKSLLELWVLFDSYKNSFKSLYISGVEMEGLPYLTINKQMIILSQNNSTANFLGRIEKIKETPNNKEATFSEYLIDEDLFWHELERKVNSYFWFPFWKKTKESIDKDVWLKLCKKGKVNNWFQNCHNDNFKWVEVWVSFCEWRGTDCYAIQFNPCNWNEFSHRWYDVIHETNYSVSECVDDWDMLLMKIKNPKRIKQSLAFGTTSLTSRISGNCQTPFTLYRNRHKKNKSFCLEENETLFGAQGNNSNHIKTASLNFSKWVHFEQYLNVNTHRNNPPKGNTVWSAESSKYFHQRSKSNISSYMLKNHVIPFSIWFHILNKVSLIQNAYNSCFWFLRYKQATPYCHEQIIDWLEYQEYFLSIYYIPLKMRNLEFEFVYKCDLWLKLNFSLFQAIIFTIMNIITNNIGENSPPKSVIKVKLIFEAKIKNEETFALQVTFEYYDDIEISKYCGINTWIEDSKRNNISFNQDEYLRDLPYGLISCASALKSLYGNDLVFSSHERHQTISFELFAKNVKEEVKVKGDTENTKIDFIDCSVSKVSHYYDEICNITNIYERKSVHEEMEE